MTGLVDVVIVNYNTRDLTAACVASLAEGARSRLGRVIVVDNGSSDDSVAALGRRWPRVEILALGRNAGFAAANNVALRLATAPYVLLLNSDTVVPPGAMEILVGRLEATGVTAAGPRLVDASGRPEVSFGSMLTPWTEFVQRLRGRAAGSHSPRAERYIAGLVAREREVDWVSGACLLVRREAALAAGLLDERYFMYEEDVDFCAALRARGGRVLFSPACQIVHLRGGSRAGGNPDPAVYDRSHLAFYEKHAPRWVRPLRWWLTWRGRGIR